MVNRNWWLVGVMVLLIAGCSNERAVDDSFKATDISGAGFGRDFHLTDHNGKSRSLGDFRGKVVLLTFGYTHCPDICPTTLANLAAVAASLGKQESQVQVLFVTLDPDRDKPALLASYLPFYRPGFLGLWGDEAATAAVARAFGVYYQKRDFGSAAGYSLDHTSGIFAFDQAGNLRLFMGHDFPPRDIVHEVRLLLAT